MQHDTLDKLAADLNLDRSSAVFRYVWEHLRSRAFTEDNIADDYREALGDAKTVLKIARQYPVAGVDHRKRRLRLQGVPGWRLMEAALERRAADEARQDTDVLAFRRDVLDDRLIIDPDTGSPTHAAVQAWLKAHSAQLRENLWGLATSLAEVQGWAPYDALVFVLTDATPPKPVIRTEFTTTIGTSEAPRITVTAAAWVPPHAVADLFKSVRDRLKAVTKKKGQRRRARALNPRAVAVVAFVEQTSGSWEAKRRAWNTANPGSAHFGDRANFRRTYQAARRRLAMSARDHCLGSDRLAVTRPDGPLQPVSYFGR
jgi:hypothetical protein